MKIIITVSLTQLITTGSGEAPPLLTTFPASRDKLGRAGPDLTDNPSGLAQS